MESRSEKPLYDLSYTAGFTHSGSPMVSSLKSGLSGLWVSPGQGYCDVVLDNMLYSHSASLEPVV